MTGALYGRMSFENGEAVCNVALSNKLDNLENTWHGQNALNVLPTWTLLQWHASVLRIKVNVMCHLCGYSLLTPHTYACVFHLHC